MSRCLGFALAWGIAISVLKAQDPEDSLKVDFIFQGVTITATRIPEPLYEVPMAVSVVQGQQLRDRRGYGLDQALGGIPGVLVQSRAGSPDLRIAIRGFGARGAGDRSNAGTSRGIRIYTDGLPETEPDGRTSLDFIDPNQVETIEVVRSNASAVWGNAAGGVINIQTVPSFDSSFVTIQSKAGSFGYRDYSVRAGTRIGDGRFVAGVSRNQFDGWRDHSAGDRILVNLASRSMLSPGTELGLSLMGVRNEFEIPGPLTEAQYDSSADQANPTYATRRERRNNLLARFGATLDHRWTDDHTLTVTAYLNPKYLQRSERGTYRDFTRYHLGGSVVHRVGFRLNDSFRSVLLTGVDESYQDGAILFYDLTPDGNRSNVLRTDKREGANHVGIFFQNEVLYRERWTLMAGLRYDNVTYYSQDFLNTVPGHQKKSFIGLSPKAGFSYRFHSTHSVYANIGSGIEVPAGNETDPAGTFGQDTVFAINPLLDPIRSWTFELGTRQLVRSSSGLIAEWSYELAVYRIQVNHDIIPYRGGRFYFTAGKTHRTGIEAAGRMSLDNGLSTHASVSISKNEYAKYLVDSVHYSASKAGLFADYEGNDMAGVPPTTWNAGLKFAPRAAKGVYVAIDAQMVGSYFVDDANRVKVPAYTVWSLAVGMDRPLIMGRVAAKPFISVQNLTDRRYVGSAFINPDIVDGQPVYIESGLPRQWTAGVSLTVK